MPQYSFTSKDAQRPINYEQRDKDANTPRPDKPNQDDQRIYYSIPCTGCGGNDHNLVHCPVSAS